MENVIQLVDQLLTIGGRERVVIGLSSLLNEKGITNIIGCFEYSPDNMHSLGLDSISRVVTLNKQDPLQFVRSLEPTMVVWHTTHRTLEIVEKLAREIPVVSIIHNATCPSGSRLFRDTDEICSKPTGLPCLIRWYTRQCGTTRNPMEAVRSLDRIRKTTRVLNACNKVYAPSESIKSYLSGDGVDSSRIYVYDISKVVTFRTTGISNPIREYSRQVNRQSFRILYIGRLTYEKGVQYLLRAIKEVSCRDASISCSIVGDGWYRERLEDLVKKLGLENIVTFYGSVSNDMTGSYIKNCDLVVVPSIYMEAAALVVPEAVGHGKRVLVSDVGGLSEWRHWSNYVVVTKPADVEALSESLVQLFSNPENQTCEVLHQQNWERIDIVEDLIKSCSH